jgi:hypothetical protein
VDQKGGSRMKMQDERDAVLIVDLIKRKKELETRRKELESRLAEVSEEKKAVKKRLKLQRLKEIYSAERLARREAEARSEEFKDQLRSEVPQKT